MQLLLVRRPRALGCQAGLAVPTREHQRLTHFWLTWGLSGAEHARRSRFADLSWRQGHPLPRARDARQLQRPQALNI